MKPKHTFIHINHAIFDLPVSISSVREIQTHLHPTGHFILPVYLWFFIGFGFFTNSFSKHVTVAGITVYRRKIRLTERNAKCR
jgi:hypothetical protein